MCWGGEERARCFASRRKLSPNCRILEQSLLLAMGTDDVKGLRSLELFPYEDLTGLEGKSRCTVLALILLISCIHSKHLLFLALSLLSNTQIGVEWQQAVQQKRTYCVGQLLKRKSTCYMTSAPNLSACGCELLKAKTDLLPTGGTRISSDQQSAQSPSPPQMDTVQTR